MATPSTWSCLVLGYGTRQDHVLLLVGAIVDRVGHTCRTNQAQKPETLALYYSLNNCSCSTVYLATYALTSNLRLQPL